MKLAWTHLALRDIANVHEFVVEDSERAAISTIAHIDQSARMLLEHPSLGRAGRLEGTRELIVPHTPFIIAYRLKPKRIEILAVIHAARRWSDSL